MSNMDSLKGKSGKDRPRVNNDEHIILAQHTGYCFTLMSDFTRRAVANLPRILPHTDYGGEYQFHISFEPATDGTGSTVPKATPWVYEAKCGKLFVKMGSVCPILFHFRGKPPRDSVIRGVLMYRRPESQKEIVTRCLNHRNTCEDGHPYQDHVMRCENPLTHYEVCPSTGRLSVVIPIQEENFAVGDGYFKEFFKFTCFNSCVGGMDKRPTNLLFRLEYGGAVHGRAVVEVRICASPGRDYSEKESSAAPKNTKKPDKRSLNEPSSTMAVSSSQQPSSSTFCYPNRTSVLMSARRDVSGVIQEPFRDTDMAQGKRPCGKDGFTWGKRTCDDDDDEEEEEFTLKIKGRRRYEAVCQFNDELGLRARYGTIKENTQCNKSPDTTPQSSQEIPLQNLSQLSRTSSNASSMSSSMQAPQETFSLEKSPRSRTAPQ